MSAKDNEGHHNTATGRRNKGRKYAMRVENDEWYLNIDSPEKRLLVAILVRAIMDYANPRSTLTGTAYYDEDAGAEQFEDAQSFLFEEGCENEEFSFEWILQHIANHPEHLKHKIRKFVLSPEVKRVTHINIGRAFSGSENKK